MPRHIPAIPLIILTLIIGLSSQQGVNRASIWDWWSQPQPTITNQTPNPATTTVVTTPTVTVLTNQHKTIHGVIYRIDLSQITVNGATDGYRITINRGTTQLATVDATKTQATKIYNTLRTYKPNSSQMLIARLIVLALF